MKTTIIISIILIHFLFFISLNSFSQSKAMRFTLVDSLSIPLSTDEVSNQTGSTLKYYNNSIYYLKHGNSELSVFSLSTKTCKKISLQIENEINTGFVPWDLHVWNNLIYVLSQNGKTVLQLSNDGSLIKKITFNTKANYFITERPIMEIDFQNQLFYISVNTKINRKDFCKNNSKLKKYYTRNGLIRKFDTNGKLLNVFGQYDSIYYSGLHQSQDDYFFRVTEHDLLLSQQLSSKIDFYNLNSLDHFSRKLKYNKMRKDDLYFTSILNMQTEELNKIDIESLLFHHINVISRDSIFSRTYFLPIKDTSEIYSSTSTTIEKNENNSCRIISKREWIQTQLMQNKPCHIQFFDKEGNIYFDDIFLFKGTFIFNNNFERENVIYSCLRTNNQITIYTYNFKITEMD